MRLVMTTLNPRSRSVHHPGLHHHRQGTLPHVLHVRAGVPGQGDPHHRGPGPGDRRALHRLRQLRAGLLAARQAAAQHDRRGAGAARARASAWPPAWPPAFPPSSSTWTTRRWSACCGRWASTSWSRWPSAPTWSPGSTGSCCSTCNGHRYISTTCPAIISFVERYYPDLVGIAGADRLADDRHGPGAAAAARRRPEGRVHRPVHRQEGGGPERRAWPARSTPCSRSPSCGELFADDGHLCRRRRAERFRSAARRPPAACFPSAAACCRRPTSAKT